jgi:hypothetical protein
MADNSNIFVEFDYQNIIVVDPNKIVDQDGQVKDRLVNHEDMVMYANLECQLTPRTKLRLGIEQNELQTIEIAKINFLRPGGEKYLNDRYTQVFTGKEEKQATTYRFYEPDLEKEKSGVLETSLLGITNINFNVNTSFLPKVTISLQDVRGRALFELGDKSPYAALVNLPYPMFYLTLKGYYGKAVRYQLMLQNFHARFDDSSGNFDVTLTFLTYKYTVLAEVSMGYLLATPQMFPTTVTTTANPKSPTSKTVDTTPKKYTLGYQKIKELYDEYKSKGIIDENLPEYTITQLQSKLDTFIKDTLKKWGEVNMAPLTHIETYSQLLTKYKQEMYFSSDSWFKKNLDPINFIILKGSGNKVFISRKPSDESDQNRIRTELSEIIIRNNKGLDENPVLGKNGQYEIGNKKIESEINNRLNITKPLPGQTSAVGGAIANQAGLSIPLPGWVNFNVTKEEVDFEKTFSQIYKKDPKLEINKPDFEQFQATLSFTIDQLQPKQPQGEPPPPQTPDKFYGMESKGEFLDKISQMEKDLLRTKDEITKNIGDELNKLIKDGNSGLGFTPTIRNVLAIFFANGEAFLRLMDDCHSEAWSQRDSEVRKKSILGTTPSSEKVDEGFVYPWPQLIKERVDSKGVKSYNVTYPGDPDVINETQGFLFDSWPEIEFVEELLGSLFKSNSLDSQSTPTDDEINQVSRISLNSIEYPLSNIIYQNKEEVKFFYEFWERMGSVSNFSRLTRGAPNAYSMSDIVAETESTNMINALGSENVFLIKKLKEYDINPTTIRPILRAISNLGEGESYQKYIRGYYSTPYIKSYSDNDFRIFDNPIFARISSAGQNNNTISETYKQDLDDYISSTESEEFEFNDTFPFTDSEWNEKYLAKFNGSPNVTKKTITWNESINAIANYDVEDITSETKRPVTYFNYLNSAPLNPFSDGVVNSQQLKTYYKQRTENSYSSKSKQLPTEGEITYSNYDGGVVNIQTTSMMNTPYFINAIQKGVLNFRTGQNYPYREATYLFLNSLPLATLKEKYKSFQSNVTSDLDYIFACFKKYGAVHKIPYSWILKYGSLWHRYKYYVENGNDFLDGVWSDFDYLGNYDPSTSATTKTYVFTGAGAPQETRITLQFDDVINNYSTTEMDLGFYPKLINDFSVFFNGYNIFPTSASGTGIFSSSTIGFNSQDIQNGINSGLTVSRTAYNFASTGFDSGDSNRTFLMNSYSVTLNDINDSNFFLMPSVGNDFNQSFNECFKNIDSSLTAPKLKIEPRNNKSVFNGSVRCFWIAPNFGWFDNSQIEKPLYNQYLKKIKNTQESQDNFNFTKTAEYSYFDELTSTFKKDILDQFEQLYLNFSSSRYKFLPVDQTEILPDNVSVLMNFHLLFTEMMKLPIEYKDANITQLQELQFSNYTSFIKRFMEYDLLFKYGNPSEYNKQLYLSFTIPSPEAYGFNSILDKIKPLPYSNYTPNALPNGSNQTTLADVETNFPDAWKALLLHVGNSQVDGIKYTDQGSTIFDFFIDNNIEFSEDNVISLYPLIKIYATQKKLKSNYNSTSFKTDITKLVDKNNKFQDTVLKNTFKILKKNLANVSFDQGSNFSSKLIGAQGKVELWESLKALNDKWIAGYDLKYKTIFEDVLLLDRASRDLGDKVLVNIFDLNSLIQKINTSSNLLYYIQSILQMNNFQVMALPSYVNFYNVQDPIKDAIPKVENSLEFANDMFGTHPNVDYRNSGPKMVCFYAGKPSEHPQINKPDYAYQDDGIYFQKLDTNTLQDNLVGKKDWAKSNRVVGFTVDMGIQNQNIFTNISVSQDNGKATTESMQQITDMANQAGNRSTSTQNTSLYNLYKSRSYGCSIKMMGNAMIQPMMYFNLRHIPMFSGSYMILGVNHNIQPGSFTTQFDGVRQSIFSLPDVESYIQAALTTIISTIFAQNKQATTLPQSKSANTDQEKINQKSPSSIKDSTPSQSDSCSANTAFSDFQTNTTPQPYTYNDDEVIKAITAITSTYLNKNIGKKTTTQNLIDKINYLSFCIMNHYSYKGTKQFLGYEYNFGGVRLDAKINGKEVETKGERWKKLNKEFFCMENNGVQYSLATFNSLQNYLEWKIDYIKSKVDTTILNGKTLKDKDGKISDTQNLAKDIDKFILTEWPYQDSSLKYDDIANSDDTKRRVTSYVVAIETALAAGL